MIASGVHLEARPERAHLAQDELLSLLRGELGGAERRRVVRHLLAGCPECQALGREIWGLGTRARKARR